MELVVFDVGDGFVVFFGCVEVVVWVVGIVDVVDWLIVG